MFSIILCIFALFCFNLKSIKNFIIVILLLYDNSISCITIYYLKTNKRNHHFTQWKILGTTFYSFCSALSGIIFYIILLFIENFKYVPKQKEYHMNLHVLLALTSWPVLFYSYLYLFFLPPPPHLI